MWTSIFYRCFTNYFFIEIWFQFVVMCFGESILIDEKLMKEAKITVN